VGLFLAGGLLVNLLILTVRYGQDLRWGWWRWLLLHACVPISFFYLLGAGAYFLFGQAALLYATILPVYFFGFWSLLVAGWQKPLKQLGHLAMLAAAFWAVWLLIDTQAYGLATRSFLLGLPPALLFIGFQLDYSFKHPQEFKSG